MLRKYLKSRLAVLLALALLVAGCPVALSGCEGGGFGVEQTNLELNIEYCSINDKSCLEWAVNKFKETYPEVTVNITQVQEFETLEEWHDYITQFKARLMVGDGPDILLTDNLIVDSGLYRTSRPAQVTDLYKVMKAGAFADLNKFIENDPDFHLEDYNEAIMQSGVLGDKRFFVPLSFLTKMLVSSEAIMEESEFHSEAASQAWPSLTKAVISYSRSGDMRIPPFSGPWADESLFRFANIPLIDYDNGTINREAAEDAKKSAELFKDFYSYLNFQKTVNPFTSPLDLLEKRCVLTDIFTPREFDYLADLGMGIHLVLLPIRDREGKTVAEPRDSISITNTSPNQQNAWNLIKILLSSEAQKKSCECGGFAPVRLDAEETYLAAYENCKGQSEAMDKVLDQYTELALNPESVVDIQMDGYSKIFDFMEDYFEGRTDDLDKSFDEALVKLERYMSE